MCQYGIVSFLAPASPLQPAPRELMEWLKCKTHCVKGIGLSNLGKTSTDNNKGRRLQRVTQQKLT
jgi:hypothetical protein